MSRMSSSDVPHGLSSSYWRSWAPKTGLSVGESLDNGEEWIGSWDAVGLYEQNNKVPGWQELVVHLTTHRLLLLQALSEPTSSKVGLQTNMSYIRQTEFYVGFMRSSPKITLSLCVTPSSSNTESPAANGNGKGQTEGDNVEAMLEWSCPVCGHSNAIGDIGYAKSEDKCGLCGVTYGKSSTMGPNGRATPLSTSRPSTPKPTAVTPSSPSSPSPAIPNPDSAAGTGITCPACTFLNHPSIRNCEICESPLPRNPLPRRQPTTTITTMPTEPAGSGYETVRLSFRGTGTAGKECYRRLKNVLSDKAWETRVTTSGNMGNGESVSRGAGIDGIMQQMTLEAKVKDDSMQDAFKDLEVLMVRAGEMVRLAQSLSAKLPPTPQNSQEETLLRTSLVQLGLPTPALTQDMVRDDRLYLEGLAKELGTLLVGRGGGGSGGLMLGEHGRGVVGLDEVWVIWMRARGLALLPPSTLISILPHLPRFTDPSINLLTLPSSLKVLHTPHYSTRALLSRTLDQLSPITSVSSVTGSGPGADDQKREDGQERSISAIELASIENLAIGMAKEMLESAEMVSAHNDHTGYTVHAGQVSMGGMTGLVRDDQAVGGTRWYRDLITGCQIQLIT